MNILKDKLSLSEQVNLLERCIEQDIPLADALYQKGLTYDTLRYEDYSGMVFVSTGSERLDDIEKTKPLIPAVSFFSGAGGLDIGFEYAGFDNLVSIEFNEIFCDTLRINNPSKAVIGPPLFDGDIRKHEYIAAEIEKVIGSVKPFDGVFHGGPPCQSFSIAANQRFAKDSENFKRQGFADEEKGELLFDYLWYIKLFKPLAFLIENVAGIADCDTDGKIKTALYDLSACGYDILPPQIANAAHYGVPQNRMRWLIIGTRAGKNVGFPKPNESVTACYDTFCREFDNVKNHQTREHTAASVKRYMALSYGGRDKLGRVDRLNPYLPSKTVIAGGTKGGGRSHLHPYCPRTISVRECARLQTFPDSYIFTGATARQFTQVGNAVPPLLAYKIARCLEAAI
jgi:DNA (cytosine-5)-methyltransferase 1